MGLIPGSGRSPGEGNGKPLQYSCLGNPMDRRAWWATVHGGGARGSQRVVQDLETKQQQKQSDISKDYLDDLFIFMNLVLVSRPRTSKLLLPSTELYMYISSCQPTTSSWWQSHPGTSKAVSPSFYPAALFLLPISLSGFEMPTAGVHSCQGSSGN